MQTLFPRGSTGTRESRRTRLIDDCPAGGQRSHMRRHPAIEVKPLPRLLVAIRPLKPHRRQIPVGVGQLILNVDDVEKVVLKFVELREDLLDALFLIVGK